MWEDVVTAGLIGTDRRPVPESSRQRAGVRSSIRHLIPRTRSCRSLPGIVLSREQAVSCRPARRVPVAPARTGAGREPCGARDPGPTCCPRRRSTCSTCGWSLLSSHGQRVSASYWTPLAMVAARTTADLDRKALGSGNRRARRLVCRAESTVGSACQEPAVTGSGRPLPDRNAIAVAVTEDAVRADPRPDHACWHAMV